jgi:hypothetical protein
MLVLLMGTIYEVRHGECLRWHDIHTKFHEGRYMRSEVIWGDTYVHTYIYIYTHTHTYRQQFDLMKAYLYFLKIREVGK